MTEYLRYVLKNIEPLRIADGSTSQNGQTTTLRYIPGPAIRGLVVNALAKEDYFEQIKKQLFTKKIRFLNAYIMSGTKELLPSPKGFYESKITAAGKKIVENVVMNGEFTSGYKRASLGRYCYIDSDCIHYYSVDTGSDIKIKMNIGAGEKQNVYRNEYITANHVFVGYIAIEEESLKEVVKKAFPNMVIIGNGRSAGRGKCQVLSCEYVKEMPYGEYLPENDLEDSCYMMLLSNTVMRNVQGEICGLDFEKLQELMGVELQLEEMLCSTSTVEVKGYNRMWGVTIPSVTMFEQGSVFHFKFKGTLTKEKMEALCQEGIGIRKNEGFGRILFLKDYEKIEYKQEEEYEKTVDNTKKKEEARAEDRKVLTIAARGYYINKIKKAMNKYVVEHKLPKGEISNSQLGTVEALITAYRYDPQKAWKVIHKHFEHAQEKENGKGIQKEFHSIQTFKKFVEEIQNTKLDDILEIQQENDTIMGVPKTEIFSKEENDKYKLELLIAMIRYDNKK